MGVYLVTDRRLCADVLRTVKDALDGGVRAVQLREKDMDSRELFYLARRLRELTRVYGAALFVNDRIDVALAVQADGLHLGQRSMPITEARAVAGPDMVIGASTHGLTEALTAVGNGADFITLGPIFNTPAKLEFGEPLGLAKLKLVCSSVNAPVYAIGGIKREQISDVVSAGAAGIAVISAIIGQSDARLRSQELVEEYCACKAQME
ncbi:MAG: thiamine-phosphate diphosphorylase [Deltaproteobacteria bacterium RIFCSPLOWO2_02_FULL_53_8]|nr:MAG: thiamine-phosphate diphosphorylase [Deltaproteobacteria bacterium RIFCSPLOWO2_02_FULL_53_8]